METSISGCISAWHGMAWNGICINGLCLLAIGQTRCSLYANRCIQAERFIPARRPFSSFTSAPAGRSGQQQGDRARRSAPVRRPIATLYLACFLEVGGHWTSIHLTRPLWVAHTSPSPLALFPAATQLFRCSCLTRGSADQ